jgi:hypothetical protein
MTESAYLDQRTRIERARLRELVASRPWVTAAGAIGCGLVAVAVARWIGPRALSRAAGVVLRAASVALAPGPQA